MSSSQDLPLSQVAGKIADGVLNGLVLLCVLIGGTVLLKSWFVPLAGGTLHVKGDVS